MRRTVLVVLALLASACGGSSATVAPSLEATEAPETGAESAVPHLFVQVDVRTDKAAYELGEPVLVTRVFEDRGPAPASVPLARFGRDNLLVVGVKTGRSSGLYDATWVRRPSPAPQIGGRVEGVIRVELAAPGTYTLEVPPAYVARGGFGDPHRLEVTVADRGDARHLRAKAERLGEVIAKERLDFASCWTEAQGDLQALGPAAIPYLRRWLRESDSVYLRAVSAKLLGHLDAREGVPELIEALGDEQTMVRRQCVTALGALRDPAAIRALLAQVDDPDPWVRVDTYDALAAFDDARVPTALRAGLEDEDPIVRGFVALDVAERGDEAAVPALIESLRRDPWGSACLAVPALEALTRRSFGEAGMPHALSVFDQVDEAGKQCEEVAAKWLAWWEAEGQARYDG